MDNNEQNFINIVNATENNLKHVSLKIPKKGTSLDPLCNPGNLLPVHNLCTNPCNADHISDQDLRSSIRSGEHDIPELYTNAADPECGKSI